MAMIKIDQELEKELQSRLILQIHDELIFECPDSELPQIQKLVKEAMENVTTLKVPLKVDMSIGKIGENAKIEKIAVTGLVSSGKSTACHIMGLLGAYVISCDAISKELLKDPSIIKKLVSLFGETILKNREIDHAALAGIVFEDREKLKKLELLLHPLFSKK